jgi:hypothetical protein
MNCDDFLHNWVSGGMARRTWARMHAARCARCTTALADLARIEAELARTEPLTAAQRSCWEHAINIAPDRATDNSAGTQRLAVSPGMAAILAAILVGIAVFARQFFSQESIVVRRNSPPLAGQNPTEMAVCSRNEIVDIEGQLKSLSADLDRLSKKAELLDVRREVRELVVAYPKLAKQE